MLFRSYLTIIEELRQCGYQCKGEVMNAMYFNVPQSRERVIIIGVRNDIGIDPTHPKPQTRPIPAREVIAGCIGTRSQRINPFIPADESPATLCKTDAGWQALVLTQQDLSEAAIKPTWQSYRVLKGLEAYKHFGLVRLKADKVAPTLVKDAGNTTIGQVHPFEIRKLTIPEAKRIGSFPDDFKLTGSFHDKWARIGNSVPPNLMQAIAEHVRKNILCRYTGAHAGRIS